MSTTHRPRCGGRRLNIREAPLVWTEVDDAQLAARFAAGEPDTIRIAYERYSSLVYSVAFRVLGDAWLSEDATQLTFVQAWQAAGSYDPARSLAPWLTRIARHAAIDVVRKRRPVARLDDIEHFERVLVSPPPSLEQLYVGWEVRRAVLRLPDHDRQIIRLQHYAELTQAEIATQLGIPIGTVKSRSFRAHRRLAGLLGHLRADPQPVATPGYGRHRERGRTSRG
jgi:RNA polymerase sigma-70 factor (ECF subfamily)